MDKKKDEKAKDKKSGTANLFQLWSAAGVVKSQNPKPTTQGHKVSPPKNSKKANEVSGKKTPDPPGTITRPQHESMRLDDCMLSQDGNSQDSDAAEVVWARSSPGMARSLAQGIASTKQPLLQTQDLQQQQQHHEQQQFGSQGSREEVKQSLIQAVRSTAATTSNLQATGGGSGSSGAEPCLLSPPPGRHEPSPLTMSVGRPRGKVLSKPPSACRDAEGSAAEGRGAPEGGSLLQEREKKEEGGVGGAGLCVTQRTNNTAHQQQPAGGSRRGEGAPESTGSQELLDEILAGIGAEPTAAAAAARARMSSAPVGTVGLDGDTMRGGSRVQGEHRNDRMEAGRDGEQTPVPAKALRPRQAGLCPLSAPCSHGRHGSSSSGKRHSGQKRKALLELLDQVEVYVKGRRVFEGEPCQFGDGGATPLPERLGPHAQSSRFDAPHASIMHPADMADLDDLLGPGLDGEQEPTGVAMKAQLGELGVATAGQEEPLQRQQQQQQQQPQQQENGVGLEAHNRVGERAQDFPPVVEGPNSPSAGLQDPDARPEGKEPTQAPPCNLPTQPSAAEAAAFPLAPAAAQKVGPDASGYVNKVAEKAVPESAANDGTMEHAQKGVVEQADGYAHAGTGTEHTQKDFVEQVGGGGAQACSGTGHAQKGVVTQAGDGVQACTGTALPGTCVHGGMLLPPSPHKPAAAAAADASTFLGTAQAAGCGAGGGGDMEQGPAMTASQEEDAFFAGLDMDALEADVRQQSMTQAQGPGVSSEGLHEGALGWEAGGAGAGIAGASTAAATGAATGAAAQQSVGGAWHSGVMVQGRVTEGGVQQSMGNVCQQQQQQQQQQMLYPFQQQFIPEQQHPQHHLGPQHRNHPQGPTDPSPQHLCNIAGQQWQQQQQQQAQPRQQLRQPLLGGREDVHFVVLQVEDWQTEKLLRLLNEYKGFEVWAHLRDLWQDTPVQAGDVINVLAPITTYPDGSHHTTCDFTQGLLVLHPDVLLSGTTITSVIDCPRKAWLQELVGGGGANDKALQGTMMHELVQYALAVAAKGPLTREALVEHVHIIIRTSLLDLVEVGLDEASASDALLGRVDAIMAWVAQYMGPDALVGQVPSGMHGKKPGPDSTPRLAITDVVDIEEMVWAPRYGLKGQIDATLGVVLSDANHDAAARASAPTFAPPYARNSGPATGSTMLASSAQGSGASTGTAAAGFGPAAVARSSEQMQRFSGGNGHVAAAASPGAHHSGSGSVQSSATFGSVGRASGGRASGGRSGVRASSGSSSGPAHFRGSLSASAASTVTVMRGHQHQQQQQQQQQNHPANGSAIEFYQEQQYAAVGYEHPGRPAAQIVPFEFKSGRNYFLHRAQVSLYLMLMEDRYQQPCDLGLLWNINDGTSMQPVKRVHSEMATLMMQRNRLAAHLAGPLRVPPPMLRSEHQCSRCFAQDACGIYHKSVDGGTLESSGMSSNQWHSLTAHLSRAHAAFFKHWAGLVDMEEAGSRDTRPQLWAMRGEERERLGTCVAGLYLVGYDGQVDTPEGRQHCYTFTKRAPGTALPGAHGCDRSDAENGGCSSKSEAGTSDAKCQNISNRGGFRSMSEAGTSDADRQNVTNGDGSVGSSSSLLRSVLGEGEMGLLGLEGMHANIARIIVHSVSEDCIRVVARKELQLAHKYLHGPSGRAGPIPLQGHTWRLDKDEPTSTFNQMRGNLVHVSLMSRDDFVAARLRALIVDLEAPASNEAPLALPKDGKQRAQAQEAQPREHRQQPQEHKLEPVVQLQPEGQGLQGQQREREVLHAQQHGGKRSQEQQESKRQQAQQKERQGLQAQQQEGEDGLQARQQEGEQLQAQQHGEQGQQEGEQALALESKAESEAEAKAEARAGAKAEAKAEATAEAKALADAEAKALANPEAEAEAKALASAEAKAEAKAEAVEGTAVAADAAMNEDQQAVVRSVLRMRDYALVLGMPGTGKTSTIVRAISALLRAGHTVLLTAYTHSAVDNIALKLATAGIDFVRIPGSTSRQVHPALRDFIPGGARFPGDCTTTAGLEAAMCSVRVVAVTCLGVRHPLLARRSFDVCVLDEASQVSLPASLGPLSMARSFVLVGDHYQLPPLVASPAALAGGYGESLFRRLSEAHPQAIVTLRRQYRMAADIMALSNELVYNGTLLCGSESVARGRLHLAHWCAMGGGAAAAPGGPATMPSWVKQALDPERRVVFVDTTGVVSCVEKEEDGVVSNSGEAGLVGQLVQHLLECGAQEEDIGLVSPYRAQVSLLEKAVHAPPSSTTAIAAGTTAPAPAQAAPAAGEAATAQAGPAAFLNTAPGAAQGNSMGDDIPGLLQLRLPKMALTQGGAASRSPAPKLASQPLATAQPSQQQGHENSTSIRAAQPSEQRGVGEMLTPAGEGEMGGDVCVGPGEGAAMRPPIEVLTIDKYQGRDKPCILLSFVRSNTKGSAGRLLADWQRLNVALTRAKHKLVMVGCAATLQEIPLLGSMLQMVEKNGWRLPLSEVLAIPRSG